MKSKKLFVIAPAIMAMSALIGCNPGTAEYTVTFDTDGGTAIAAVKVKAGEKVTKPTTNPTKNWFKFNDWYKAKEGTDKFSFDTAITADTTIYAHYDATKLASIRVEWVEPEKVYYYGEAINKEDIKVYAKDDAEQEIEVDDYVFDDPKIKFPIVLEYYFIGQEAKLISTISYTHGGLTETCDFRMSQPLGRKFEIDTSPSGNYVYLTGSSTISKGIVYLPDYVECTKDTQCQVLGPRGFSGTTCEVTKMVLHSSNTKIYNNCFNGNTHLTEINIPSGFLRTGIDDDSFTGCTNLKTVTIDSSAVFNSTDDCEHLLLNAETVYVKQGTPLESTSFIAQNFTHSTIYLDYNVYKRNH